MTKYDIYLIWGKDHEGNILRYYGSTANFIKRKSQHKDKYNRWVKAGRPSNCKYSSVFILDNGDWKMEKIDEIDGERWEARKKEGEYQKNNDCVNVRKECRTTKEYWLDNKEKLTEWQKKYNKDNKDKIKEKKNEWINNNKDKIAEYRKEYYKNNKDKLNEINKKNYEKNKQAVLEKQKEKIKCECGSVVTKNKLAIHKKTKKHINFKIPDNN